MHFIPACPGGVGIYCPELGCSIAIWTHADDPFSRTNSVILLRAGPGGHQHERLDAGRRRSVSTTSLACWLLRASTRPRAIATTATRSSKTGLVAMLRQLELPLAPTIRGDERSLAILSVALGGLGGERVAQRGPGGYAEFGKDLVQVGSDRPM